MGDCCRGISGPSRYSKGLVQLSVGTTAKFIECSCGIPCLHALEVHSRSDSCSGFGRVCC